MQRIVVVGCQGSGKTRLALELGRQLDLPVIHLDVLYWLPGWQPSDTAGFRLRVAEAIAGDRWVVDGSFAGLALDLTLAAADVLVIVERPRWLCQWRIMLRSAFGRRGHRPDLPAGCPEVFDWGLMREAWHYDRDRRPMIEAECQKHGAAVRIIRLPNDRAIAAFLSTAGSAG